VLYALGDVAEARSSYRRYVRLVGAAARHAGASGATASAAAVKRPLEPYFLKQADRFIIACADRAPPVQELARHCGVSWRTLEKAFVEYRGITPVAHLRNRRLDAARRALEQGEGSVAQVASRYGFGSPTTFALEFRRRFGISPSRARLTAGRT
jgi:AraC family transcriptional regulator